MPGHEGKRDTSRAIELCKSHAHAGDSYAQFDLAWALIYHGETNLAYEAMKKAMLSGFPPATLDFAVFVWHGWGTKERYLRLALRALRRADQAGHKAALEWRCFFYKSGQVGFVRRVFGYLLAPIARLRYILALWRDPFSCRIFMFQTRATGPLLRQEPRPPYKAQWASS
jgi:TPR repeat protein